MIRWLLIQLFGPEALDFDQQRKDINELIRKDFK